MSEVGSREVSPAAGGLWWWLGDRSLGRTAVFCLETLPIVRLLRWGLEMADV